MQLVSEFLFAHAAVATLANLRGPRWQELVARIAKLPATDPDALAFALTMIRVNGCVTCDIKRYRERGGCAQCSKFVLTTINKESEAGLLTRFRASQKEIALAVKESTNLKKAA